MVGKGKGRATSKQPATATRRHGAQFRVPTSFEDEDDLFGDNDPPPRSRPTRKVGSGRSQPAPLFLDDDDDVMDVGTLKGSDEDAVLVRGAKRKAVVLAGSDSDDGGFKGPSNKRSRR